MKDPALRAASALAPVRDPDHDPALVLKAYGRPMLLLPEASQQKNHRPRSAGVVGTLKMKAKREFPCPLPLFHQCKSALKHKRPGIKTSNFACLVTSLSS